MGRCILVGAAPFECKIDAYASDFIIAADGGYAELCKQNIAPNLIVGDFDSLSKDIPGEIERVIYPVEKDDTDMRIAYLEGKKRGYKDFLIYGGAGGRIDHTLANFSLMLEIEQSGGTAILCSDDFNAYVISSGTLVLAAEERGTVSVFAIGGIAEGVSITGLKYQADNITLCEGFALGVSNSFTGKEAKISVDKGCVLIIKGKGY